MKKIKLLLLMFMTIALLTSITSASFLIINEIKTNTTAISNGVDTKKTVTFIEKGQVIKTMQVDKGYQITISDLPKTIEYIGRTYVDITKVPGDWDETYQWYDNYNNYKWISSTGIDALNHIVANNITFIENVTQTQKYLGETSNGLGGQPPDEPDTDEINNTSSSNNQVINFTTDTITEKQSFNYQIDGNVTNYGATSEETRKRRGLDNAIGLSDNNISNKVVLQNDVIMFGSMTIGGRTGYYGNDSGNPSDGAEVTVKSQTQLNFQGYLMGDYCQLDLNGNTLVVRNGGILDCWGSVIDSKGTGKIVLESGSVLYSPFVVEDMYREDSMPVSYFNNDAVFTMYRMPYLECNVEIRPGAKLYGKYRISLGSDGTASGDILLVGGEGSGAFLEIKSKANFDGYLKRTSYIDPSIPTNTFITNNMINQKIRYEANNIEINMNEISFKFDYSSMTFDIHFGKTQFWIPPYFDFALYNSKVTIKQFLIFMPGVNMYVDYNSEIFLSQGLVGTQSKVSHLGSTLFEAQSWHSVGGLLFLDKMYLKDTTSSLRDLAKGGNTYNEWFGSLIYYGSNVKPFWIGLEPAKCDMYGKITFDSNISGLYHTYMLGGNINISNIKQFKNNVSSNSNVRLYAKAFESGPNMVNFSAFSDGDILHWTRKLNICAFYTLPLISNGQVLMNPLDCNSNTFATTSYTYDSEENIIIGNNSAFMYLYNDQSNTNLYRCKSSSDADSLDGSYVPLMNYDTTNHKAVYNNQTYICFQGNFIAVDDEGNGSVAKFCGEENRLTTNNDLTRHFKYNATDKFYVIG